MSWSSRWSLPFGTHHLIRRMGKIPKCGFQSHLWIISWIAAAGRMSRWREDAACGVSYCVGNESPPPLLRAATRTPMLLVIQLPLACTQFRLWTLAETFSSWDCTTPNSFCFLFGGLNAAPSHPGRTGAIQIYFAHSPLSWGICLSAYTDTWFNTSWPTLRNTGHIFATGWSDAAVISRNRVHGLACQALCQVISAFWEPSKLLSLPFLQKDLESSQSHPPSPPPF